MRNLVRPDGSCNHIAVLDPKTGILQDTPFGQGYEPGSAWSRGQAWGLYGFALSARHTGKKEYLDTAKRIANYFLANVSGTGYIPRCDFRAPLLPEKIDTTAGACAACGLLEIASMLPESEAGLYRDGAYRMIRSMEERYADWDLEQDGILNGGRGSYHGEGADANAKIIYGDYYFTECILRLKGKEADLW